MAISFRNEIERQALAARREMLRTGELLSEDEFRKRLHLGDTQLKRMIARGDVFTVEVDDVDYFPSILATPGVDRRRLNTVCRILVPAPPGCRLGYLSSAHANLGGISPIVAMRDKQTYRLLQKMARAYAIEWWRTAVTVYPGCHHDEPSHIDPIVTAVDEVDPREPLWQRAEGAMRSGGYIYPYGPYSNVASASVFVVLQPAGDALAVLEAKVDISSDGSKALAIVSYPGKPGYEVEGIPIEDADNIVDVVILVIVAVRAHELRLIGK